MRKPKWTITKVRKAARKFKDKMTFKRENCAAYQAARRLGILDQLFKSSQSCTVADAFYIWKAGSKEWKGNPVIKIGITSSRLGFERIYDCAGRNKLKVADVWLFKTEHATKVERCFHDVLREVPDIGIVDGKTEFRACSEVDLSHIVSFAGILGERLHP